MSSKQTRYPDRHPDLREHLVRVLLPGDDDPHEYMPRDQWETAAKERDENRRVLALISVWRLQAGAHQLAARSLAASPGERGVSGGRAAPVAGMCLVGRGDTAPVGLVVRVRVSDAVRAAALRCPQIGTPLQWPGAHVVVRGVMDPAAAAGALAG